MDVSQEAIDKIQRFADQRDKVEETYEQQQISSSAFQAYNRKLDDTIRELQDQVKRQEDDLRRLRAVNSLDLSKIGSDPWARVSQVKRAKQAYDSLIKSETEFPSPGSTLPSLLAVKETSRLVKESKLSVSMTAEKLSTDRQRLKLEETNLKDAQTIKDGLKTRIENIRREKSRQEEKTPSQLAREFVEHQQLRTKNLDKSTENLKKSLHKFIDETLASMIAAENLGGPTIGDNLDISDATLLSGYTNHGKPKKPKNIEPEDNEGGQRRIDELLSRQGSSGAANPTNKREAAAKEMHDLLDALIDAVSSYIDLPRESAASRFLVRAKIAQFHPRDARRLRMIDFGRSLND